MIDDPQQHEAPESTETTTSSGVVVRSASPSEGEPGATLPAIEDFDADAMVRRLHRNAIYSLIGIAILVFAIWREVMPVVGALLGGGLVMLNFVFLERLATGALRPGKQAPNPLQLAFMGLRVVLMALMLYGIFVLPGIHPIPVAIGLSILVLAVMIEALSELTGTARRRH